MQKTEKKSVKSDFKEGDLVYLLKKNIHIKRLSLKLDFMKLKAFQIKRKIDLVNY